MISYSDSVSNITPNNLHGFFGSWPNPPSPTTHLEILSNSDYILLAFDNDSGNVVGYITGITDHVSSAFIPHLEVLPRWQGQGIGSELVERMLEKIGPIYAIDLMCDPEVEPFYERLGFKKASGMMIRNYDRQSCR